MRSHISKKQELFNITTVIDQKTQSNVSIAASRTYDLSEFVETLPAYTVARNSDIIFKFLT